MSNSRDQEFSEFAVVAQYRLLRLADLLTGDRARAEDLVQTALVKVYLAWAKVRDGHPEAYARTIIVRAHTDAWRRVLRRERSVAVPPEPLPDVGHEVQVARRDAVLRALSALTTRERTVIVLRFYVGLSEAEIAAESCIAIGTVKSATARAMAKLRTSPHLRPEVSRA